MDSELIASASDDTMPPWQSWTCGLKMLRRLRRKTFDPCMSARRLDYSSLGLRCSVTEDEHKSLPLSADETVFKKRKFSMILPAAKGTMVI